MIQLMNKIFQEDDETKVNLLFANRSEKDIFLKDQIEDFRKKNPERLNVTYVVDHASSNDWKGETGYINKDIINKYLPKPSNDTMIFICGPDQMYQSICGKKNADKSQGPLSGILKEMGYSNENVYKF